MATKMMLGIYKAMPDLHLTIEDMIAEGDRVGNIWRWTDTASGRKIAVSRLRALAFRRQDRRALGHSNAAGRRDIVDCDLGLRLRLPVKCEAHRLM
jgi:hypothetical protein